MVPLVIFFRAYIDEDAAWRSIGELMSSCSSAVDTELRQLLLCSIWTYSIFRPTGLDWLEPRNRLTPDVLAREGGRRMIIDPSTDPPFIHTYALHRYQYHSDVDSETCFVRLYRRRLDVLQTVNIARSLRRPSNSR